MKNFYETLSKIVAHFPNKTAIIDGKLLLSYGELLDQAKHISHNISARMTSDSGVVVVFLPRSSDLILTFLGISFTNHQFVPLSPGLPLKRIRSILVALKPQLIIADDESSAILKDLGFPEFTLFNSLLKLRPSDWLPNSQRSSFTPLYTLFTSGSTGTPKGITVSSGNFLNFIRGMKLALNFQEDDVFLARTFIGFDISFLELYFPLFVGATVVVCREELANDPEAIADMILEHKISVIQATPSFWTLSKDIFISRQVNVSTLLVGGEALQVSLAKILVKMSDRAFNMYGPTETTIWSTFSKLEDDLSKVSLGLPILNTFLKILDDGGQLKEIGKGELLIGGEGVSLGYLNRDDLNREKFIRIDDIPYFKSGDLVTICGAGDIEYHGRIDNQVKIRGNRVELGEIESLIENYIPGLRAVVKVADPEEGTLCAVLCKEHSGDSGGSSWSEVWNDVYGQESSTSELDTSGWINSFTQKLYQEKEIRDWRDSTVRRIKSLVQLHSKSKVLELGVGTGMILSEILPQVGHYTGMDSSANVIQKLQKKFHHEAKLHLEVADIQSFLNTSSESYDLIIMNSVSQYLENLSEFENILKNSLSKLRMGGAFFIGDIRNFDSYREFHACRYLLNGSSLDSFNSFLKDVKDTELLISPSFFEHVLSTSQFEVKTLRRNDAYFTEMSAFRYDAIICQQANSSVVPLANSNNDEQDKFLDYLLKASDTGAFLTYEAMVQTWEKLRPMEGQLESLNKNVSSFANTPYRSSHGNVAVFSEIHRFLEKNLPSYMLPKLYKMTDSFPYTSSGKLDRNGVSLEGSESLHIAENFIPPVDELETDILAIIQSTLKTTSFGMMDNLWSLGLTSLTVARIARTIKEIKHFSLRMIEFYKFENARDIANRIRTGGTTDEGILAEKTSPSVSMNLSSLQTLLAQASQIPLLNKALNVCFRLKIRGPIDSQILKKYFVEYFNSKIIFCGKVTGDFLSVSPSFSDSDFVDIQNTSVSVQNFFTQGFDVQTERPIKILIETDKNEILIKFHHYCIDGESIAHIIDDLRGFLNGRGGHSNIVADSQFRYNEHIRINQSEKQDQYWVKNLENLMTKPLELGVPRTRQLTHEGHELTQNLSNSLTSLVRSYAGQKKVTPYSVYLYAFFICLQKHTDAKDIAVAIPVTGRHNTPYEDALGCLINFLPMRFRVGDDSSHEQSLINIQKKTYEYMDRPGRTLNEIFRLINSSQDTTSVISAAFAYDEDIFNSDESGVVVESEEVFNGFTQFSLAFRLSWHKGCLQLRVQYDSGFYDEESVVRFTSAYVNLIEGICLDLSLSRLLLPSAQELSEINRFLAGPSISPSSLTIRDRLDSALASNRYINFEDKKISPANFVRNVASDLQGVRIDTRIGILMEESSSALLSQMACWFLGYPIVMMSPDWGEKRLEHIVYESEVKFILTDTTLKIPGAEMVQFDSSLKSSQPLSRVSVIGTNPLLYIIYTSGTTGLPKGVQVSVNSFENFLISFYSKTNGFPVKAKKLLSTFASTFDAFQLTVALFLEGAEVYFLPKADQLNFDKLFSFVRENGIEIAEFPTSVVEILLDNYFDELRGSGIKVIYFGGEALSQKTFLLMKKCSQIEFFNLYGPAENTVISTISCVTKSDYPFPTIGKPLPNQQLLILDQNLNPCRVFKEGELYVSGKSLSQGYVNTELDSDRFLNREGQRLYRTGDFGMWLPDGDIYFTGRKDGQVQLRGHRIELDEIDFQISQVANSALIRTIVVGEGDSKKLVSFINSDRSIDKKLIFEHLRSTLPLYMIPSQLIDNVQIRLNTNGKIDYRALLQALADHESSQLIDDHDLVDNPVYELLSNMIKDLLASPHDPRPENDLFSLGGNSLVAIRLRRRLLDEFSLDVPVKSLFTLNVRELVELIEVELMNDE